MAKGSNHALVSFKVRRENGQTCIKLWQDAKGQILAKLRQNEKGQALAELPWVILIMCVLILMMIQPAIYLYTQMTLGQVAVGIGRIVATKDEETGHGQDGLLHSYAADRLAGLPRGDAFWIPGTLQVEVSGNSRSEVIEVSVSLKQEPLPLMGFLVGASINQNVEVTGHAVVRGTQQGVEGTPQNAPQQFGFVPNR
ncbi:MAG: hypothetical protein FWC81_00370 [Coriobacteriia bacterium]|nr:hypothetical protein [Coriobacteriia bacterium]